MTTGPTSITMVGQRLNWADGRRMACADAEVAEAARPICARRWRYADALRFRGGSTSRFSVLDLAIVSCVSGR